MFDRVCDVNTAEIVQPRIRSVPPVTGGRTSQMVLDVAHLAGVTDVTLTALHVRANGYLQVECGPDGGRSSAGQRLLTALERAGYGVDMLRGGDLVVWCDTEADAELLAS
jgi:hypothetical protein